MKNKIIQGDSLEELKKLPDNSVDAVVTDPPYGLGFMNKEWDSPKKHRELVERERKRSAERKEQGKSPTDAPFSQSVQPGLAIKGAKEGRWFQEWCELWSKELLRILKPGGYFLSFSATRMYHRMVCGIEDAGFEIRDMISWLYGSGFPKSLNVGKQIKKIDKNNNDWDSFGTALKPAVEPIVITRKPLSEKNVALNVLKWGTGGINIDACRVGTEQLGGGTMPNLRDVGKMSKESMGIDKLSFGQNPRPAERKEYPTYQGRFPANLILDEEAGKLLDEQSGQSTSKKLDGSSFKVEDNGEYVSNVYGKYKAQNTIRGHNDKGGASRFFYCAKASKKERNLGCEEMEDIKGGSYQFKQDGSLDGKIPIKKNKHPTVKPLSLIQYLIKLVSKEGAVVLDPFLGSGTTAIACVKLNRNSIGIEKEEEYVKIAKARIKPFLEQRKLK